MRARIEASRLVLALFVGLSIVGIMTVTPAFAATTYSCTITVSYSSVAFTVKTVVTATNGYLSGPAETDLLKSYRSGSLYNTQSVNYSVAANQATTTIRVPVSSAGSGTYTFSATILNNKGSMITACSGTYTL